MNAETGNTEFRFLHTMIRVLDLDKSVDFYTRHLGMRVLSRRENETGRYTLVFLGYGEKSDVTVIELTYNWGRTEPYDLGNGWGHLAVGVPDLAATCAKMEKEGVNIPRPPGPVKGGTTNIAFIDDPDGYKIELVEHH